MSHVNVGRSDRADLRAPGQADGSGSGFAGSSGLTPLPSDKNSRLTNCEVSPTAVGGPGGLTRSAPCHAPGARGTGILWTCEKNSSEPGIAAMDPPLAYTVRGILAGLNAIIGSAILLALNIS